jgi:hypothetical protein
MDGSTEPKKSLLARLFWSLVAAWYLLGLVSSFVLAIGLNFIASTEWVAATHHLRMILGLASVPLLVWVVWKGGEKAKASEAYRLFVVLFSPFFGYILGGNILFIWPLLLPLIAGHEVALPFTVLRATDIGVKYCHSPVILADMPFAADGVCHVPESIRTSLSPGSRIVVRGWGTRLGVYARELRLTD